MESCFGNYILLGKRADQPMIDVKAFKFIHIGKAGNERPVVSASYLKEEKIVEVGLSTKCSPNAEDTESEKLAISSIEWGETMETYIIPKENSNNLIKVHKKLEDVLKTVEMMITKDIIDIQLYRSFDERQRSLTNKMISMKYRREVLDIIETATVEILDLRSYLAPLKKSDLREILKTRFQIVIGKVKQSYLQDEVASNSKTTQEDTITCDHININTTDGVDSREDNTNQVASPPLISDNTPQQMNKTASQNELTQAVKNWIESMPIDGNKVRDKTCWLGNSSSLITHIALVPSKVVKDLYYEGWENRVRQMFWDKSFDLNSLYGKIKNRLKLDKKFKLPLTLYEFDQLDLLAAAKISSLVNQIETYIEGKNIH